MKFLFIYPPSEEYHFAGDKGVSVGAFVPPLGILYLSKILEEQGHSVEVLDYNSQKLDKKELQTKLNSADVCGMTIISARYDPAISLSQYIKKHKPTIPLLVGGPHCTIVPQQSLQNFNADICAIGDAEQTINLLTEYLSGQRKLSSIPGICYKDGDKIKTTNSIKHDGNLDKIPFPSRHLVEKYEYGFFSGRKLAIGKTTSILTTRGCPFRCRFCAIKTISPKYFERSVENVCSEIQEIASQGYQTLQIVDDNFLANRKRAEKIMDYIINEKFGFEIWIAGARADSANRQLYKKMKQAGVVFISFGLESGNQDVLDFYNKKITLNQIRKAIDLSIEMDFYISGSFILGAPIETKKHIRNTIEFAKSLNMDFIRFLSLGYLLGSPLWIDAVNEGKIKPDEYVVLADKRRGLSNFTKEELEQFCIEAHNEIFYDPRFFSLQLLRAFDRINFRFLKVGLEMIYNP